MENSKMKKILIVLAFLIFVSFIAFLIWNTFFKGSKEVKRDPGIISTSTGTGLPTSEDGSGQIIDGTGTSTIDGSDDIQTSPQAISPEFQGQISPIASGASTKTETLVSSPSMSTTLSRDGNSVQFYNKSDGKFYVVNDKGDILPLSNKVFHNVKDVEWAPNKTKAVIEYPDGNKIVYDFASEKQVTLPKHWEDFSFSPDSNKLVNKSLGIDPDNRWLIVSNSDGSQSKAIEFIGLNDKNVIPSWSPNNQTVAMYTEGIDFNRREVFFLGQNNENFKSTVIEGWGFQPKWADDGAKLLYSVYSPNNDLKPRLWIVNSQGDQIGVNRKDLELETWAEKCNFINNQEVYCAVPKELEKGSGLYPELAKESSDNIYKINIQNGTKELIAIPDISYNISNISVSSDEKFLFFTDNNSNQIHKIQLQ